MAYTPNPDKPGEVEEIQQAIRELHKCQLMGRWDLMALNKWLEIYPDSIITAIDYLDDWFENQLPPVQESIHASEDHGSIRAHHHQAS